MLQQQKLQSLTREQNCTTSSLLVKKKKKKKSYYKYYYYYYITFYYPFNFVVIDLLVLLFSLIYALNGSWRSLLQ